MNNVCLARTYKSSSKGNILLGTVILAVFLIGFVTSIVLVLKAYYEGINQYHEGYIGEPPTFPTLKIILLPGAFLVFGLFFFFLFVGHYLKDKKTPNTAIEFDQEKKEFIIYKGTKVINVPYMEIDYVKYVEKSKMTVGNSTFVQTYSVGKITFVLKNKENISTVKVEDVVKVHSEIKSLLDCRKK